MTVIDTRTPARSTADNPSSVASASLKGTFDSRQWERMFNTATNGMRIIGLDRQTLYVNDAFCRLTGWDRSEALEKLCCECFPGDACDTSQCPLTRILNGDNQLIYRTAKTGKSGSPRTCTISASSLRDETGALIGIVEDLQDTTHLDQVETELSSIFNLAPDLIGVAAPDGTFRKISPSWETVLGFTTEEIMNMGWTGLIHPDDIESTGRAIQEQREGSRILDFVNRYRHKDGTFRILEWRGTAGTDGLLYAMARDITERRRDEDELKKYRDNLEELITERTAELRKSEEMFSKAFYSNPALMTINAVEEGVFLYANDAFLDTLGYDREEVVGRGTADIDLLVDKEMKEKVDTLIGENGSVTNIGFDIKAKDGRVRHGLFSAHTIELQGRPCVLTIMIDISERKLAEQQLKEAYAALTEERTMLERKNVALKEVIDLVEKRRQLSGPQLQANVDRLVRPVVKTISEKLSDKDSHLIDLLETSLGNLMGPGANWLHAHSDLSPREREICSMIKQGFRSKEIARIFNTAEGTVEQQRKRIRRKLGLKGSGENLTSYLKST